MNYETKQWLIGWIGFTTIVLIVVGGLTLSSFAPARTMSPAERCVASSLMVMQSSFCMEALKNENLRNQ